MKIIYSIGKSDFSKVTHSRIFKLAISLFVAIAIFAFIFWQVEKTYRDADTRETIKKMKEEGVKSIPEFESFSYIDAIENIAIFTISGFDTDPPKTAIGWVAAILSLIFGIVLVGAFTAEISSIFVESRLKDNSAVKN